MHECCLISLILIYVHNSLSDAIGIGATALIFAIISLIAVVVIYCRCTYSLTCILATVNSVNLYTKFNIILISVFSEF